MDEIKKEEDIDHQVKRIRQPRIWKVYRMKSTGKEYMVKGGVPWAAQCTHWILNAYIGYHMIWVKIEDFGSLFEPAFDDHLRVPPWWSDRAREIARDQVEGQSRLLNPITLCFHDYVEK